MLVSLGPDASLEPALSGSRRAQHDKLQLVLGARIVADGFSNAILRCLQVCPEAIPTAISPGHPERNEGSGYAVCWSARAQMLRLQLTMTILERQLSKTQMFRLWLSMKIPSGLAQLWNARAGYETSTPLKPELVFVPN